MSAKRKMQSAKRRNCVAILYDTSSTASGPPSPQGEGKSRLLLEEKLSAKLTDEVEKSPTNSNLYTYGDYIQLC